MTDDFTAPADEPTGAPDPADLPPSEVPPVEVPVSEVPTGSAEPLPDTMDDPTRLVDEALLDAEAEGDPVPHVGEIRQATSHQASAPILSVEGLTVDFRTDDGEVHAVRGVDFSVSAGEVLAVVGESGSGKSVTAMSILKLLPPSAKVGGQVLWQGSDLLTASEERMRQVRGGEIAMIFQDPLTALNPVYRVGDQIVEMILVHEKVSKKAAKQRAIEMLDLVGIPQANKRVDQYTHEFSGGMRQRAMIAMALSCNPKLIIADEPTTALDVTVQAQVLEVLADLAHRLSVAVVLITHDLGVVAGMADQIAVMYAGRVVETGTVDHTFDSTSHPYTAGLLASLPRLHGDIDQPLVPIGGQPPSMLKPPPGCSFHPRCLFADAEAGCMSVMPELAPKPGGQLAACHRSEELLAAGNLVRRVEVES
jgi:oligopeptide/dipeptide ABC transporter ATP-binding protein